MKKLMVFILAIAVTCWPVSATAAPPSPGSSCSKVGAKVTSSNRVFTCIKTGSKRVWSKGVVVKVKTEVVLTWQNAAANAARLNENVWAEALKYKTSSSRQVVKDRWIASSPNAYLEDSKLNKVLNDAESFFSWSNLPTNYKVLNYSRLEADWAANKANEWFSQGAVNVDQTPGGHVLEPSQGEIVLLLNPDSKFPLNDGGTHLIAHEFVHVLQFAQSGQPMQSTPWLIEGGANFFAVLINSKNKTEFDQRRTGHRNPPLWKDGVLAMLNRTSGPSKSEDYSWGFYVTQALGGMYGLDKVVNFYKATSENPDFSDAFFKSFGDSWETVKPNLADTMIALSKLPW